MGSEVKERFSFGYFVAGGALATVAGFVGNIVAMAIAGSLFGPTHAHNPALGFIIGMTPGLALIFLSLRVRQNGLAQGVLCGAIVMTLGGGLCGGGVAGMFG